MRIVIVGVGDMGSELAKDLARRKDNELVLVETDEKRCEQLSSEMDALVINGDGSNPEILEKAQIERADVLVAVTGSDAINTVIAMLGRRLEVEKVVVKLNGVGLRPACQEIGVRRVVTPKISAAAEIVSAIYGFDQVNFSLLSSGGLTLDLLDISESLTQSLSDLEMPEGSHIVAIKRGDKMLIPRASLKLKESDQMLLLNESEEVFEKVKKRFTKTD